MVTSVDVKTSSRQEAIDITAKMQGVVKKSGTKDGVCRVFTPHTTAGVMLNEHADSSVMDDVLSRLAELAPRDAGYQHAEGNSDAHIKSSIVGSTLELFIENSKLKLGTWQGVFFLEFDGPRQRQVWVKTSTC